jgi:hypothetical protein
MQAILVILLMRFASSAHPAIMYGLFRMGEEARYHPAGCGDFLVKLKK